MGERSWGVEEEGNGVGKKGLREGRRKRKWKYGGGIWREGWESGKKECRG